MGSHAPYGFIHDKLDIKLLVLYIMARVAGPIDFATLTDLTMCDGGVDYFEFAEAAAELVASGHLTLEEGRYAITDKGRENGAACESSLPYSVKRKCDENLSLLNAALRRAAQVRSEIFSRQGDEVTLRLALDDDGGNLLTVELLCPSREQADALAARFQARPERFYHQVLSALLADPRKSGKRDTVKGPRLCRGPQHVETPRRVRARRREKMEICFPPGTCASGKTLLSPQVWDQPAHGRTDLRAAGCILLEKAALPLFRQSQAPGTAGGLSLFSGAAAHCSFYRSKGGVRAISE